MDGSSCSCNEERSGVLELGKDDIPDLSNKSSRRPRLETAAVSSTALAKTATRGHAALRLCTLRGGKGGGEQRAEGRHVAGMDVCVLVCSVPHALSRLYEWKKLVAPRRVLVCYVLFLVYCVLETPASLGPELAFPGKWMTNVRNCRKSGSRRDVYGGKVKDNINCTHLQRTRWEGTASQLYSLLDLFPLLSTASPRLVRLRCQVFLILR